MTEFAPEGCYLADGSLGSVMYYEGSVCPEEVEVAVLIFLITRPALPGKRTTPISPLVLSAVSNPILHVGSIPIKRDTQYLCFGFHSYIIKSKIAVMVCAYSAYSS